MLVALTPGGLLAQENRSQKRIVYTVPGMEAVKVERNIIYKRVNGSDLKMDVYLPPAQSDSKPLPGVLLLHGGPLPPSVSAKDWGVFVSYGQLLAASGFVAVAFNHRFSSLDELPTAAGDIQDALRYVRDKAESFRLDRDKLCLWAFSGAGVLLTGPLRDRPAYICCLVAYYPVFDPQYYKVFDPQAYREGEYTGDSDIVSDEVVRQFSPVRHLKTGNSPPPPLLIARTGKDHPVLNQYLDLMVKEGLTANVVLDVMNHPSGQHGFDVLNDDTRSREIIARTLSFLKTHLGEQ
jgi:dipeptidyl aminopeptidase/acylaminoacyl peptidase